MIGAIAQMFNWHDERAKTPKNRFRADGITPYGTHPFAVLQRGEQDGIKSSPIHLGMIFHDVLEDTTVSSKEFITWLVEKTSPAVARETFQICADLTDFNDKFPVVDQLNRRDRKSMINLHIANYACAGALVVKVYDRWHNLFTLKADPSFRQKYLDESFSLFEALKAGFDRVAPLGHEMHPIDVAKKRLDMMMKEYSGTSFLAVENNGEIIGACTPNDFWNEYEGKPDFLDCKTVLLSEDQYLNFGDPKVMDEINKSLKAVK